MTPQQARALGQLLRQHREALGLTVRQLEDTSGVDDSSIVRLERGMQTRPSLEKLTKLATALKLSEEDVLAMAGVTQPKRLPSFRPYLRAKYPQLPSDKVSELQDYLDRLMQQYGDQGPAPGEDEGEPVAGAR